jgi:hypothetical protein
MEQTPRRTFIRQVLGGALAVSLVKSLCAARAVSAGVRLVASKWLAEVEEMTEDLRGRKVRQTVWQAKMEELFARLELKDLLRAIDYAELTKAPLFPEDHESALDLEFPNVEGLPRELSFVPMFIAFKRGRAIVPHGHHNMVSMHMVLDGEVHARHYERRGGDSTHLIIEPSLDKTFARGDLSTVSDDQNNVHWFRALTGSVFMFNVAVFGIDGTRNFTGRDYVDPLGGDRLGDGTIRARRLTDKEAFKLYGNT